MMRTGLTIFGIIVVAAFSAEKDAFAQQENHSGAVETFSPQLDVGYAMRPGVGMFGITELMMAALEGKSDDVQRLVEQGANIEETDDTGGTPLMWAAQGGDIDIVNYLLDSGADIGAVGGRNVTAFMIAVMSGKQDIGVRLLDAGATFRGELSYQQDYLEYAAANGQAKVVRALIQNGADLDGSGTDALCFAIRNRHIDAARELIEAGVDVNERGEFGNDLPIIHALQQNDEAIVRLLVDAGAKLNRKDKADRVSIMYYATQTGQPSIVSYLLDSGATLEAKELDQLLGSAIYKGSMEMANLLVARGASISSRHLFNAIANRQFEMADAFADAVGIESMDDYMLDGLIDQAASSGHQAMVDELLSVISSREDGGRLRLLFETVEADRCKLNSWDPQDRAVTSTVLDDLPCDAELFIARRQSTLFVVQGADIDVRSLDGGFRAFHIPIPTQGIEARVNELRQQFAQRYPGDYNWVNAKIVTLGYLDDGRIILITHTSGPADGTFASQFAWDGAAWTLVDTQGCHRFDWICHVPGVDGRSTDRWPVRGAVWHTALQRNSGFVERVALNTGADYAAQENTVVFDFDGRSSKLGYVVSGSDHCAEECTFTDSVTINPDGTDPIHIVLANSRVSIAGQFILVRPTRENWRLYDLATGENVLGDVGRATWIH